MRLIDADALIEFEEKAWDGSAKEVSPSAVYNIILDDIREAKTIDAIPVEWIKSWCKDEPYWINLGLHMLDDWRAENEAD